MKPLPAKIPEYPVLYVSYDGMLEPLGQSQVLRYLERLGATRRFVLVSFEKSRDWNDTARRDALRDRLSARGIDWIPLRYHKSPRAVATAYDILRGILVCGWIVLRRKCRIVHTRSYVPAVIGLTLKKLLGVKFVFDMRGFWADERVDGGLWAADSRLYRVAKWFERKFLLNADCIVSLTHRAAAEIASFPYLDAAIPRVAVITTCTDLELFRPTGRNTPGDKTRSPFTLGYSGSVGTWYLLDEVLRFFQVLRSLRQDAVLYILNRDDHTYIRDRLRAASIDDSLVRLAAKHHNEVADAIRTMDAAVFFYRPAYSRIATAPTKMGEFLASGIPCLGNAGVGDIESIFREENVGVTINGFSDAEMHRAAVELLKLADDEGIAQRCRSTAARYFSLDAGAAAYEEIYRSLQ